MYKAPLEHIHFLRDEEVKIYKEHMNIEAARLLHK